MTESKKTDKSKGNEKIQDALFAVFPGLSEKDHAAWIAGKSVDEPYQLGPDSMVRENVPRGEITQYKWKSERFYRGTERDYWIYVPQQYDETQPVCLMIFLDGALYLGTDINVPIVFDNLIDAGEMPITIGLFINAGDKGPGMPLYGGGDNRSFEYDSLGNQYSRFLIEEFLPEVMKKYRIVSDPEGWAICGTSSGAICAFTVAWERPDVFGKVVSHCGSFVNIRDGHNYPSLIRRNATKPIRISLQTRLKDLNLVFGTWSIANQDMAAALAYRDYDYQFSFGEGGHSLKHGGAIFPETMRWLWRDYPKIS